MSEATKWLGTVVTAEGLIPGGAVVFAGETLLWVGPEAEVPAPWALLPDAAPAGAKYLTPGLIDVHCHGGGGASFPDVTEVEQVGIAAAEHLRHGTTTMLASLVTASLEVLEERAQLLARGVEAGLIKGIHYEGPFLSEARCGAQDPRYLVDPTVPSMRRLMAAAGGHARSMTIAPERSMTPEGRDALQILVEAGAIPSWGHTDGNAEVTGHAIDFGVELLAGRARASVTHMFNGMPPLHHRQPGPIARFLEAASAGRLVLELICDGVHIDPSLVGDVVRLVGRDNCVFVTDAMAAAGMPDGSYQLGPQVVTIEGGVARLAEGSALAGGTSHLLDCVRVATEKAGLSLVDAIFLAATQGARLFHWDDRGCLEAGRRADVLALGEELNLVAGVRGGAPF